MSSGNLAFWIERRIASLGERYGEAGAQETPAAGAWSKTPAFKKYSSLLQCTYVQVLVQVL